MCGISAVLFFRRNAIDGHTVAVRTVRQLKAAHLSLSRRGHITLTVLHRQLGRIVLNIDADFDFLRGTGHRVHDLYGYLIDFGGFVRIVGIRMLRVDLRLRVDEVAAFIHAQLTVGRCGQIFRGEHPVFAQCLRGYDRVYRRTAIAKFRVIGDDGRFLILQHGVHVKGQTVRNSVVVAVRHRNGQLNVIFRHISFRRRHIDVAVLQCHGSDAFNLSGVDTVLFGRLDSIDGHRVTVGTVRERICTN